MSKMRNPPTDQHKTILTLNQLNGFWLLRSITETTCLNQKLAGTLINRFPKPLSVLIENINMSLIWNVGTEKARTVPIQIYRGKVVTRPLLEMAEIRANCELSGKVMKWQFVINRDINNYSQYKYEFIRDSE
jgi:hypothetical protein